ncbi:MAG: DUF308 domain-containing protein [Rhodobacter sp.]|nr:DUF308 domain-containing protein [Paracoccaceae bacterium]MCC0075108.1 DUF308 domain-containing protein [Rhodobacter sp.]
MTKRASLSDRQGERRKRDLGWVISAYAVLGLLCLLAPVTLAPAAPVFVAVMMLGWGGLGLGSALVMRPFPEYRPTAIGFGVLALLGLGFVLFPGHGDTALQTMILVAAFLVGGIGEIFFALRLSRDISTWPWLAISGVVALVMGFIVLVYWPDLPTGVLGVLSGLNFLSTALALYVLRRWHQPDAA